MFNLLFDEFKEENPIPNCNRLEGLSTHNNIIAHFTNFNIPFTIKNSKEDIETNKLSLYCVEPQEVFNIMNPRKKGFMEYIPKEVLSKFQNKNNKVFLLIWFPTEGFSLSLFNNMIPEYIKLIIQRYSIPKEKVLLVYGDLKIQQSGKATTLFNYIDRQNVFGLNIFEYVSVGDFSHQKKYSIKEHIFNKDIRKDKNKLFLLKNGVSRPHRMYMVTELYRQGLLDLGFYSWINHTGMEFKYQDYKRIFWHYVNEEDKVDSYIQDFMSNFYNKTPIVLDKTPNELKNRSNQIKLSTDFIHNSYFSIVTETVVDNENEGIQFFSEKIFQPIHNLHPFIVTGCPYSLQYLRDAGYATFPELFNEEYDKVEKESIRTGKIIGEIKKVSMMDKEKLKNIIYSDYMLDKLKHNQNLVQTQPNRNGYYKLMNWLENIYYSNDL